MKNLMKKTACSVAACAAVALLSGCGGQPERYEDGSVVSVFVWNQDAWAEHPGVVNDGDLGTPISSRRRLIGKRMTLTFNEPGVEWDQTITISFDTQSHCNVITRIVGPNGGISSNATNNHYDYVLVGNEGKAAKLTVTYISIGGDVGNIDVDLVFTSALHATATIQEVRTGGDIAHAGVILVEPGTPGNVEWVAEY